MARQFEIARWNKPLNWNFLSQILSAAYITYILHIWVYSTWMSDTAIYIYFAQFRLTFSALVFRFSLRDFSRCQNKIDNLLSFNVRESSFSIFFCPGFLVAVVVVVWWWHTQTLPSNKFKCIYGRYSGTNSFSKWIVSMCFSFCMLFFFVSSSTDFSCSFSKVLW